MGDCIIRCALLRGVNNAESKTVVGFVTCARVWLGLFRRCARLVPHCCFPNPMPETIEADCAYHGHDHQGDQPIGMSNGPYVASISR